MIDLQARHLLRQREMNKKLMDEMSKKSEDQPQEGGNDTLLLSFLLVSIQNMEQGMIEIIDILKDIREAHKKE
jgi:hypothetical protein